MERTIQDTTRIAAAAGPRAPADGSTAAGRAGPICRLLESWQATADHAAFTDLFHAVAPVVANVASRVLVRHGIHDPGAVDDAVSLVFDHLRRLVPSSPAENRVAPFAADRPGPARGDAGAAFITWLTRERALDVARRRRRRGRTDQELDDDAATRLASPGPADEPQRDRETRLRDAIGRLEPRDRLVCELLLDGHSQAAIAARLGLSAGTVSRIRQRAIETLRDDVAAG